MTEAELLAWAERTARAAADRVFLAVPPPWSEKVHSIVEDYLVAALSEAFPVQDKPFGRVVLGRVAEGSQAAFQARMNELTHHGATGQARQ